VWRTFVVAHGRAYIAPSIGTTEKNAPYDQECVDVANSGARFGFACIYDADQRPVIDSDHNDRPSPDPPPESRLQAFVNNTVFLEMCSRASGFDLVFASVHQLKRGVSIAENTPVGSS
jgi:hypothetical protein